MSGLRVAVTLFSTLLGRDLRAGPRTAEELGFAGLGRAELRTLLRTGGDLL